MNFNVTNITATAIAGIASRSASHPIGIATSDNPARPADSPQCQKILNYLREHRHGLTSYEAVLRLGIVDLRKRMSEIKQDPRYAGLIKDCWETIREGKGHNRWWIEEEQIKMAI